MKFSKTINDWEFSIKSMNYKVKVKTPHTWNVDENVMKYRGTATYKTYEFITSKMKDKHILLSFNAVYHTAKIYVNNSFIGEHKGSGYTPFKFDITNAVKFDATNEILVEVDNTHIEEMLPHKDDFDWADDGGIIRKCEIQFLDNDGIEYLNVSSNIKNINGNLCDGTLNFKTSFIDNIEHSATITVYDYHQHKVVAEKKFESIKTNAKLDFKELKLWSNNAPNLYIAVMKTDNDLIETRFGIRKIEVKGEKVLLNGKEIYLKGCEWMPGSHPDFGMAEPLEHSIKCLKQLKNAGCVFTRFHWQQDDTLFDWCDENGLLVQEEIPYWGHPKKATAMQLEIAKMQADEMVQYYSNHPSIICWGVGNELGAETDETIDYIKNMIAYFKSLDNSRLVNYVSNTLSRVENIEKDDGTLYGDIAMWNDYLGLWESSDDIEEHMIRTCKKAQGMPLLVSEFGLCEPHFKGGDKERARILKERLQMYSKIENICGYMWFSLNDYRTHCGEAGEDRLKQRVHGSTDLFGNEKPSYRLLCELQK